MRQVREARGDSTVVDAKRKLADSRMIRTLRRSKGLSCLKALRGEGTSATGVLGHGEWCPSENAIAGVVSKCNLGKQERPRGA